MTGFLLFCPTPFLEDIWDTIWKCPKLSRREIERTLVLGKIIEAVNEPQQKEDSFIERPLKLSLNLFSLKHEQRLTFGKSEEKGH